MPRRVLAALASLKLALACLVGLMAVVAACTLAQARMANEDAVRLFIRAPLIYWGRFPVFPGGGVLGLVLLANLIAAQVTRLELSARKAGLWLVHLGLIALFAGEFVSSFTRKEGALVLPTGVPSRTLEAESGSSRLAYTLTLKKFTHESYPGTDIPRSFSSLVELDDPAHGERREALISMNRPLRYRGLTFYQASFMPGDQVSVLQVVRNPGWELPYLSCALVALGLVFHFLARLRA